MDTTKRPTSSLPRGPRKIYVLHPFKGAGRPGERAANFVRIGDICKEIVRLGHIPISPIHALSFLNDENEQERAAAIRLCRPYIELADEVWAFVIASRAFNHKAGTLEEKWIESAGCRADHDHAAQLGKFITYHLYEPLDVCETTPRSV